MLKPKIIVDLDNITADFFGAFDGSRSMLHTGLLPRYNLDLRVDDREIQPDDIRGWDMGQYVKHPEVIESLFHERHFFALLDPIPGAVDGIRLLEDNGYEVHLVSAAVTPHSYSEKAEWCQEYLPFVPLKRVHITSDKAHFHGMAIIDDGAHNVGPWKQLHKGLAFSLAWAHTPPEHYDYLHPWREPETAWAKYLELLEAAR